MKFINTLALAALLLPVSLTATADSHSDEVEGVTEEQCMDAVERSLGGDSTQLRSDPPAGALNIRVLDDCRDAGFIDGLQHEEMSEWMTEMGEAVEEGVEDMGDAVEEGAEAVEDEVES